MPDPRRGPVFGDEILSFDQDLIHLRDGSVRAIVATSSLSFHAMAPEQQSRTIQAFRDLLHAETGPLQLYVRVRRVRPATNATDEAEPDPSRYPNRRDYLA